MTTTTPAQYRQGDVLLESVAEIPKDAQLVDWTKEGRVVLVYGTATGHAHAFGLDKAQMLETKDGDRFLTIGQDAQLMHEEHTWQDIPAGNYAIIRQREYSPEAIRNVLD